VTFKDQGHFNYLKPKSRNVLGLHISPIINQPDVRLLSVRSRPVFLARDSIYA